MAPPNVGCTTLRVPNDHKPGEWERICRAQAALTTDPKTRALLLELADNYAEWAAKAAETVPPPEASEA
jgi:hypothetical protein